MDTAAGWSTAGIWIRLVFSLLVGMTIGIDRAMKRRTAGVKTHVLVCMGAALVMLTGEYLARTFPDTKIDVTRMGAQVISGVGFLGVGTIMITGRNQVRGLTTAACLWVCACVGLAVGVGFVEGAVYALILIVFTLKLLAKVDMIIHERANVFSFYLEFNANTSIASFMDEIRKMEIRISAFDITKNKIKGEGPSAVLTLEVKNKKLKKTLLHDIQVMEHVRYAEEL